PMTIYSEYVQNAADAVDEARAAGMLSESGTVSISLDVPGRNVKIIDNGTESSFLRSKLTLFKSGKQALTCVRRVSGPGRPCGDSGKHRAVTWKFCRNSGFIRGW